MATQMTTSTGSPVDDNQNSLTAGAIGPIVITDFHLIDKLAHFDRERIPERAVHAKGAGAHGYFEVTHDVTKYTKARVFEAIGKKTPVFARFSTVAGEKGSSDTERDPRGISYFIKVSQSNSTPRTVTGIWLETILQSSSSGILSNSLTSFTHKRRIQEPI
jgi:catalase